jgi:hypothetical protein
VKAPKNYLDAFIGTLLQQQFDDLYISSVAGKMYWSISLKYCF